MNSLSTIVSTFKRTGKRFFAKDTFEMGAALAYYTVFSLAPLVLIAIWIAGLVFGEQAAQGRISEEIEHAVGPTMAAAIEKTLDSARNGSGSTAASIVGIAMLLFGASGVFVQLQDSINTIWDVPPLTTGGIWSFIRIRLLSFAMVLGIGFVLLVSLVVSTAISAMGNYLAPGQTAAYQVVNQALSFGVNTLLFALMFKYLPDCRVDWEDVWIGAAVTSLLFLVGKYLIGLYLAKGSVASAYGAAGSLVVVLVWVYYASQILLFGAQFTQVFATDRKAIHCRGDAGRPAAEQASTDVASNDPAHARAGDEAANPRR
jgi:membrane protein